MNIILQIIIYTITTLFISSIFEIIYKYKKLLKTYKIINPIIDELDVIKKIQNGNTIDIQDNEIIIPEWNIMNMSLFLIFTSLIFSYTLLFISNLDFINTTIAIIIYIVALTLSIYLLFFKSYILQINKGKLSYSSLFLYSITNKLNNVEFSEIKSVDFKLIKNENYKQFSHHYKIVIELTNKVFTFNTYQYKPQTILKLISIFKNDDLLKDKVIIKN